MKTLQSTLDNLSSALVHPQTVSVSPFEKLINDRVLVDTYLQVYNEHVYPLLISPPSIDPNSPWLSSAKKLYLTTLLTVGAQCLAHRHYEEQFSKAARMQMAELFDCVDPYVAAAYGVLSGYHNSIGALDKAFVMNTTACSMVEELTRKQRRILAGKPNFLLPNKCDGVDLVELHITLLQDRIDYMEPTAAGDIYAIVERKLAEAEPYTDPDTMLMLKTCVDCMATSSTLIQRTQAAHINDRATATQVVLTLHQLGKQLPPKFWKPCTVNRMHLMACAFSSAIWLVCSQYDDAKKAADETLVLMQRLGTPYRDITCLACFYIVCQVFLALGDMDKYYACIELLQEIGRTHGLAVLALQSLERIRSQRDLLVTQADAHVFQPLKIMSVFELQFEGTPSAPIALTTPARSSQSPSSESLSPNMYTDIMLNATPETVAEPFRDLFNSVTIVLDNAAQASQQLRVSQQFTVIEDTLPIDAFPEFGFGNSMELAFS